MIISKLKYNIYNFSQWAESSSKIYPKCSVRKKYKNISIKLESSLTAKSLELPMVSPEGLHSLASRIQTLLQKSNLHLITPTWVRARYLLTLLDLKMNKTNLDRELEKKTKAKSEAKNKKRKLKYLRTSKKLYNRNQKSLGMTYLYLSILTLNRTNKLKSNQNRSQRSNQNKNQLKLHRLSKLNKKLSNLLKHLRSVKKTKSMWLRH